jgi:uncharacterized repeat protein (TIGR01451 family)
MASPEFLLLLAFASIAVVAALLFCRGRKRRARSNQIFGAELETTLLAFESCRGRAFPCRTLMILLATIHSLSAVVAIAQMPPQNKAVKPGRGLAQSTYAGTQPPRMPDFVSRGSTFEEAKIELSRNYHLGPVPRPGPSDLKEGRIYKQEPPAGTILTPDTRIILYVSNGQPPVPSTTPTADISVEKNLVTKGPYSAGEPIEYKVIVRNAGPSQATNVKVDDTPTNITFDNVSGACSALPCTISTVDVGSSATINVKATITAKGAFDNAVTVTAIESDPSTANNADNLDNGGKASASADVSATEKLDTVGPFRPSQSVQYTMLVSNAGPSTATNIRIIEKPENLTISEVSGACNRFPCRIANLAAGEVATIVVTASINGEGSFGNGADVRAAEQDANPDNNNVPNIGGIATLTPPPPPPPPVPSWWWLVLILIVGGLGTMGGAIYLIRRWLTPQPVPPAPSPAPPFPPPVTPNPPPLPVVNAGVNLEPGRSSIDGLRMTGPQIHLHTSLEMGEFIFVEPIPIVLKEVANE